MKEVFLMKLVKIADFERNLAFLREWEILKDLKII